MKNIEIVSVTNAIRNADGSLALPASVAWTRRLNLKKLNAARAIIDEALSEVQQRFADDEHSVKEEDGTRRVKPEFMDAYSKEQADILLQDTDVDVKKISIDDIGDITLTDAQMDTLAFMIEEGE